VFSLLKSERTAYLVYRSMCSLGAVDHQILTPLLRELPEAPVAAAPDSSQT